MALKSRRQHREYRFQIDAFTPDTIPMSRLAEYLKDLATVLGQEKNVHLRKIEGGSTVPVMLVEWEAEPKVRERLRAIKHKEAPAEALHAAKEIDRKLAEDNAKGALIDPVGTAVIKFPGRERATKLEFGPISQPGLFQGVPIRVGGENDPVPVHLEDGQQKYIVLASRKLAKDIAQYLFTNAIRVEGIGRWVRHADGEWEMLSFHATTFEPIEDASIAGNIANLREVPANWKNLDDPLAALERIRRDEKLQ